ncbi:MAG: RnfABCDGE type electron transport complex subunit G [Clostridium sp.]|nr:RnfABCDGE type electron transport complex subunit G [Clostridium sp.]
MREILKSTLVLFLICSLITFGLAFTNAATKEKIDEMIKIEQENARKKVLEEAQSFEEIILKDEITDPDTGIVKEAYKGIKHQEVVGNVYLLQNKGYGGSITITVGVDVEGRITGIDIGDNSETPGLGSKAAEEPFISQFRGIIPKEPLSIVKGGKIKDEQIDAISSATITSKAVMEAVQAALDTDSKLKKMGGT